MCDGLRLFQQDGAESCVPVFDEEGVIHGCDASNERFITYCPFCGVKLRAPMDFICSVCGRAANDYEYEDGKCPRCREF